MPQPDDGRGNLYEQVLEYAKREMDEAASKMEDIKQSLQLLEARVEAAKAVYQAVASRLNLEDEAEGAVYDTSYPEAPVPAPEPPPTVTAPPAAPASIAAILEKAPIAAPAPQEEAAETPVVSNGPPPAKTPPSPEPAPSADSSDLDIIRQHLAAKAEREADAPAAPLAATPAPEPVVPAAPPVETSAGEDDSFSMNLIRQHLEQKAQQQDTSDDAPESPEEAPGPIPDAPASPTEEPSAGGLSEADRELIGAYLRSKQN